jgi:porphobilinogen synthase
MYFPIYRPRRLRADANIRRMVRETALSVDDFIAPLFVCPGEGVRKEISSMPGNYQLSVDELVKEAEGLKKLGVPAIILFGIPESKDELGTGAYAEHGIIQQALRALKAEVSDLLLITDVCLCEYTSHGHCGVIEEGKVNNDKTLELLAKEAVSHAAAGADMVAPSDMMDGRVGFIREALDREGFDRLR